MTKDEILQTYPPRTFGTQAEFDEAMKTYRMLQTDIMKPMRDTRIRTHDCRKELNRQHAIMNSALKHREETLFAQEKDWGGFFYDLKKQLIRLNPKNVPPTARENNEPTED